MRRQRRHLWGVAVLLLSFFFLVNGSSAQVQPEPDSGTLTIVGKNGSAAGSCPLKHTDVTAGISGFIARVSVTQEFENTSPEKIEAVYTFPLPQDAAVDSMNIQVGDRVIRGIIKKREEATAMYQAAIQKGQVAALLHQQRPNIFTQSVGNILPGATVRVNIAFLVRLKYEDGTYEFSFPTVVGPRYIPGTPTGVSGGGFSPDTNKVPDASHITPVITPPGTRAGHDISIALMLDAGVPVHDMRSPTHEIDVERMSASSAVVRLRNLSEIPNKDFVFRYTVAGPQIVEGLLTHADAVAGKGNEQAHTNGFFSIVIQPPERFKNSDVSPKELVFVMDSSGSMGGFPIEKSQRLILNALDGLYSNDTFNIIRFSGDTAVLFNEPVYPTRENMERARKFINGHYGGGGTEMMKAIRAALDPSDAQDHIRIVVFLTDGYVGDDMAIIGEIQKHPNARVFAYGIGSSVNRFLLDNMAKAGRGEVEYVSAKQDDKEAKAAADRLYERLRAPLLTDIAVDFGSLPVTDVYPRQILDLFSGKPVVITGRYTAPATGSIRLTGKRAGAPYAREIPVVLPAKEANNEALPKLWAREKIDDLMSKDWTGAQRGAMRPELQKQVTDVGLTFSLLTQFTSFVAVQEEIVTDGSKPKRVDVPVELPEDVRHEAQWSQSASAAAANAAAANTTVTSNSTYTNTGVYTKVEVLACSVEVSDVNLQTATVGQLIAPNTIQDIPLMNRSIIGVAQTLPGVVGTANTLDKGGELSQNGLRTDANHWIIDGISTNAGVSLSPNPTENLAATGATPPSNAFGSTNSLIPLEAVQELTMLQHDYAAEYGRGAGSQIIVASKSGTNDFHGSASYFFGNNVLNANDWFSNHEGVAKTRMRQNDFVGTFGGPIVKNHTFFFASFDGVRALQPQPTFTTYVPSLATRNDPTIDAGLRSLLNAYPVSNAPEVIIGGVPQGYSPFTAAISSPLGMDAFSLRIDQNAGKFNLFGRATIANSDFTNVIVPTQSLVESGLRSYMLRVTQILRPNVLNDFGFGYTQNSAKQRQGVYAAYGAVVPSYAVLFPGVASQSANPTAAWSFWDGAGTPQPLFAGSIADNASRQWNFVDSLVWTKGKHTVKFGGDYRYFFPSFAASDYATNSYFGSLAALRANTATSLLVSSTTPTTVVSNNLSVYAQDDWRVWKRLSLNYGLRWEFNPAPQASDGDLRYVTGWQTPGTLAFAPAGTPAYPNNYTGFAPRAGFSWDVRGNGKTAIRGGFGIYYTLPSAGLAASYGYYPNFRSYAVPVAALNYPFDPALLPAPPAATLTAPFPANMSLVGVTPDFAYPCVYEYNLGVQQALPGRVTLEANWIGNAGRRLMRQYFSQEGHGQFVNPQFPGANLFVSRNDGIYGDTSDYNALQVLLRRRVARTFNFLANYTWAHAIDTGSDGITPTFISSGEIPADTRGASSFDRRHSFNAILNYTLPRMTGHTRLARALANGWSADAVVRAQTGMPGNVLWSRYMYDAAFGPGSIATFRADRVPGVPLWVDDATAPGRQRLNYEAFAIPSCAFGPAADACNGSLQRNGIIGPGTWQADLAVSRKIPLREGLAMIARIEMFNMFNHPNFSQSGGMLATVQGNPGTLPAGYVPSDTGAAVSSALPYANFGMPSQTAAQAYGASLASGRLSSIYQSGGPRMVQFVLKVQF